MSRKRRTLRWLRRVKQRITCLPMDLADRWSGRRDALTPPQGLDQSGSGDYQAIGQQFLGYFIELGGLSPSDRVLDLGCGFGRMAVALSDYLDDDGSLEGLDVGKDGIRWCQRAITKAFPRFRFQHADIFNEEYNPGGKLVASSYRFPYADESFDFAILTSLCTHLLPDDMARYIEECARVLVPGGTMFATFFLLDEESRRLMAKEASSFNFVFQLDGCMTVNQEVPEWAVAFPRDSILELLDTKGFDLRVPIQPGAWCGRSDYTDFQDFVIATKRVRSRRIS